MQHNKNGGGKMRRKGTYQFLHDADRARRTAHNDNVASWQDYLFPTWLDAKPAAQAVLPSRDGDERSNSFETQIVPGAASNL